jgi:hypothetical protein
MDDLEADGADGLLDQSEMDIALSARQLRFSEGSGVSAGSEAPGDAAFAAAEAACAASASSALGSTGTAEVLASLGFDLPAPAPAPVPAPPQQQPAAPPAACALPAAAPAPRPGATAAAPGAASTVTAPAAAAATAAPPPPPQHQPVEVYVRVRPLSAEERHRGEASTIAVADERTLLTTAPPVRALASCVRARRAALALPPPSLVSHTRSFLFAPQPLACARAGPQ